MHAWRTGRNEGGCRTAASMRVRRREACAYLACSGLAVWPNHGHAQATPLQRGRQEFDDLALGAARLGMHERIGYVNDWVNQLVEPHADDPAHDHWATPYETLARGAGDCEDSAIAKFFLLLASGTPDGGVRLLYAWQLLPERPALRRAHMVTVVRAPFEDPWVLDSINGLAVPLSRRNDIVPVFSFDEWQLWRRLDAQPLPPPRARLRPWQELLGRWRAQSSH